MNRGANGTHTVESRTRHKDAGEAVAERQHLLGFDLAVGKDAHKGGHKYGHNALHSEEPLDLGAESDVAEVTAERGEICAPDSELEEVHRDKAQGKISVIHTY